MYKRLLLLIFIACMSCAGMELSPLKDHVSIKMRKELFYFFSPQMARLPGLKQITYDENSQMATCWFNKFKDVDILLNQKKIALFLSQNKVPRYKKDKCLILTSFIILEQILDTKLLRFNKQITGVILNSTPVPDEGVQAMLDLVSQSTRICAKIAGIPFAK